MHRQRRKMKRDRQDWIIGRTQKKSSSEIKLSTLKIELQEWVNSQRISKRAVDSLLAILNSHGIKSLPKNHRTLLQTPVNIEINEISGGHLWYNGLETNLRLIFCSLDRDISISLNFNIDGLPLYNSSKISFWPILSSIHGMQLFMLLFENVNNQN